MKFESYPQRVMIEITSMCNYKCCGCPTLSPFKSNGHMPVDLFFKIIDEIGYHVEKVMLWNFGEPLTHPDIQEMLQGVDKYPILKLLSTNGSLLKNFSDYDFLQSIDILIISINGITEGTYQIHQEGGCLHDVTEVLPEVINSLKDSNTVVVMQTLAHKGNMTDLENLVQFAKSYGFDELSIKSFNVMDEKQETYYKFVPENPMYSRYASLYSKSDFCLNGLVINWNGEVNPCCWDYFNSTVVGNVSSTSVFDVWNSCYVKTLQKKIQEKKYLPFCHRCTGARIIRKVKLTDKAVVR